MLLTDWSSRLLIDAPVAAIALPAEGQPTEEVDRFVSQLAKRLAPLTESKASTAVIRAIRRAQFEALRLTAELCLRTLSGFGNGDDEVERQFGACVGSFAGQVLTREAELVNALTRMQRAAQLLDPGRASTDFWITSDVQARSPPVLRRRAEDAMLAELDWSIAPLGIPPTFLEIFRASQDNGMPGWFDAFALYLAWQIKTEASVRLALFPELRSSDYNNLGSMNAFLAELYAAATALAHRFDEVLRLPAAEPEQEPDATEVPARKVPGQAAREDLKAYLVGRADALTADLGLSSGALEPVVEALMASACPVQLRGARLQDLAECLNALLERLGRGAERFGSVASHLTESVEAARAGRFAPADAALAEAENLLRGFGSPADSAAADALVHIVVTRADLAKLQLSPERAAGFLRAALDLVSAENGAKRAALLTDLAETVRRAAEDHALPTHLKQAAEISETELASISREEAGEAWAAFQQARARLTLAHVGAAGAQPGQHKAAGAFALARSETEHRLTGSARARADADLGDARYVLARRKGKDGLADVEESIAAYARALALDGAPLDPMERATVEARLGDALLALARWRGEAGPADAAAASYKAALAELTPERVLALSSELQDKLGDAFAHVGHTAPFPHRLEMAVDAYTQVLSAHDKESAPLEWGDVLAKIAATQYRLATAGGGREWLERAAASFRGVLTVHPRAKPFRWAMAMTGLADTLLELAKMSGDRRQFEEVIALSRAVVAHPAGDAIRPQSARAYHTMGQSRCRIAEGDGDEEAYRHGLAEQEKGLSLARAAGATGLAMQMGKTMAHARAALARAAAARRAQAS